MLTLNRRSGPSRAGGLPGRQSRYGGAIIGLVLAFAGCDAFTSPEARVERAAARLATGDYATAMRELKLALESEPGNVDARLLLAKLSLQIGDAEAAQKELDRALEAGLDPVPITDFRFEVLAARGAFDQIIAGLDRETALPEVRRLTIRGAALTSLGQVAEGEAALQAAAQLAPDDSRVALERARNLLRQQRDAEAEAAVDAVLALDPRAARAWLLKATLQLRRADHAGAAVSFQSALDAGPSASTYPEQVGAEAGLVDVHIQLGELEEATRKLAALRQRAPGAAVTHYMAGRLLTAQGNLAAAQNELRQALLQAPEHAPTRLMLATVLLSQGLVEQARAEVERVLQSDPASSDARKLLAMVQLALNDPVAATRALAEVVRAEGAGDPYADRLMGAALVRAGSVEEGLAFLERSVAARPTDVDARLDLVEAYLAAGRPEAARALLGALPEGAAAERGRMLAVVASTAGQTRGDAQAAVERLLAGNPGDASLLRIAGAYLASSGAAERGRELLRGAVEADPRAVNSRLALATVESQLGDLGAAESQLRAILDVEPANQRAHLGLARLALARGDAEAATRRLEQAISADPSAVEARLQLSRLAMAQADSARGRALLDQAAEAGSSQPRVLNAVGEALLRSGDAASALVRFQQAFGTGLPEAGVNVARAQVALGRDPDARRTLAEVLKLRPGWPPAIEMLAMLDVREGRVGEALRRVESLRAANVRGALVDEMLGDVHARARQWPDAERLYARASASAPSARLALKRYAVRRDGGLGGAAQPLEEWLERDPRDVAVRLALAESHQSGGRLDDAAAEFERVLATAPRDPIALNNLAWVYHEKRDGRAIETARRAFDLAPAVPEIADTYGWLLVESGDVERGLPLLENAARVKGGDPDIQYHLAAAYARSGQSDRAEALLETLLSGSGPFASRAEAERLRASLRGRNVGVAQ